MKNLILLLAVILVAAMTGLVGCQKDQPLGTTGPLISPPPSFASHPVQVGPYEMTFTGTSTSNGHQCWNYEIKRTVSGGGRGFSHINFTYGDCGGFSASSVVAVSVNGNTATLPDSRIAFGNDGSCGTSSVFKINFDGTLAINADVGVVNTLSICVNQVYDQGTVSVEGKGGTNFPCTGLIAGLEGPGCFHVCGNVSESCGPITLPVDGAVVDGGTLGTTNTGSDGNYCFSNVHPGSYTISVSGFGSEDVTVPPSHDNVNFTRIRPGCEEDEGCDLTFCGFSKGGYNGRGGPSRLLENNWPGAFNFPRASDGVVISMSSPSVVFAQMPPNTTGGRSINARQQALAMYLNVALAGALGSDLSMSTDVSAFGIVGCSGTIGDLINLAKGGDIAAGDCLSKIIQVIHDCVTIHFDPCPQ